MLEGVIIVLQRGERFLVGQRAAHKPAAGYWTQVSGKLEPGESEQDAVVREAMEELGCRVQPIEKLQQLPSLNGRYLLHYWRTDILEGEPSICNDEIDELRWVTLEELRGMEPVFQEDIQLFHHLLQGERARG
jgi:8-oxo-dGTP pyrophosphatase MutT (NUDIX family)